MKPRAKLRTAEAPRKSGPVAAKLVHNRDVDKMFYSWYESAIGPLLLAGSDTALKVVSFASGKHARNVDPEWIEDDSAFREVRKQLKAYFAGKLTQFDLPLRAEGTEFQLQVWNALTKIPYGETISYEQLAYRIGKPKAVRAVGAANGANPIPIVVPCHRVIGKDGGLTGFGGGLPLKKRLLELESRQLRLL
jgi:methylated-DNA-[protein]-cysteine S-methyltransferase